MKLEPSRDTASLSRGLEHTCYTGLMDIGAWLGLGMLPCPVCRQRASTARGCCGSCAAAMFHPEVLTYQLSLGVYGQELERAIHAFKFQGHSRLARVFGQQLATSLLELDWQYDLLCAVPLHRWRYMQRGYNQSALIAKHCAALVGRPYQQLLSRQRATRQQALLNQQQRLHNISAAFSAQACSGQRILLIDDVMTTGATMTECALTLLEAGAAQVYIAAVARAKHRHDDHHNRHHPDNASRQP